MFLNLPLHGILLAKGGRYDVNGYKTRWDVMAAFRDGTGWTADLIGINDILTWDIHPSASSNESSGF